MLPKTIDWTLTAVPHSSGMLLDPAIGDGPLAVPRGEDGVDAAPQLLVGVIREFLAQDLLDLGLERVAQRLQVVGGQVGVERVALVRSSSRP